jgi:hypothetical protein
MLLTKTYVTYKKGFFGKTEPMVFFQKKFFLSIKKFGNKLASVKTKSPLAKLTI